MTDRRQIEHERGALDEEHERLPTVAEVERAIIKLVSTETYDQLVTDAEQVRAALDEERDRPPTVAVLGREAIEVMSTQEDDQLAADAQ